MSEETNPTGNFEIELNNWNIGDYGDFMQAIRTNDVDTVHAKFALVCLAWPYRGSPTDLAAYRALPLKEYKVILNATNAVMEKAFSQGN